jgi:type I restriction enzyme M protein
VPNMKKPARRVPKVATYEIKNFADLYAFASHSEKETFIFRGVTDAANHRLISTVGRKDYKQGTGTREQFEKRIFRLFKERALPHLDFHPRNEWEWLALAQHHGLPTRLLDWSYNPLVACYFAVEKAFDSDSAIYGFNCPRTINPESKDTPSPFAFEDVAKYRPPHITPRIQLRADALRSTRIPKENCCGAVE